MATERQILFSGPMVRAILAGTKTQTRRVVVPGRGQDWLSPSRIAAVKRFAPSADNWWTMAVGEPNKIVHCGHEMDGGHIGSVRCPYGKPGDRLWVRETWAPFDAKTMRDRDRATLLYRADDERKHESDGPWRPSIYMPRWASRLTLELTDVRVQRLKEISKEDAIAEGARPMSSTASPYPDSPRWSMQSPHPCETDPVNGYQHCLGSPQMAFANLWEKINAKRIGCAWLDNPWVWCLTFTRVSEPA